MPTVVTPLYGAFQIPDGISDLATFRRWVHFTKLPRKLPVHFLRGGVWIDCTGGESAANVFIRGALIQTVYGMTEDEGLGLYTTAGMLWSNDEAGFATMPDGFFMSNESLQVGRVWFSNGGNPRARATEVIGTPDLVIEIVSDVSEEKDTDWLMSAYSAAKVPEYWLIDTRGKRLRFDILTLRRGSYATTRKVKGWTRSTVLRKVFRLVRSEDQNGWPEFTLEVR